MATFKKTGLPPIVELKNISQSYDGGKSYIIKDFDFLIEDKPEQGQFIAILGPSGCGKSTILRYISGLQEPTSGEILIEDKPIQKDQHVGMVFQQYSSMPWLTVLENVSLGLHFQGIDPKEAETKARAMLKLVGLEGHEDKFAQYPTLSGGQLQRVAIARSLLANQKILLMDEPFGALDINTRLQMQELLLKIWHEIHPTIIFITHDISEAVYLGDDIYIMKPAPSKIVEHIHVDLPLERNREIKRQAKFTDIVREVEDKMLTLSK